MTRVGAASPEEEIFRPQAPAGGRKIVWGGEYLLAARKAGRVLARPCLTRPWCRKVPWRCYWTD